MSWFAWALVGLLFNAWDRLNFAKFAGCRIWDGYCGSGFMAMRSVNLGATDPMEV